MLIGSGAARAQSLFDRNENISVHDRPRPEYEALGVPAGGFLILPKITLGAAYNDNILAIPDNIVGVPLPVLADAVFTIEPQLTIQSNWNQNAVTLTADTTLSRDATYASQNSNQYNFAASGTLDVRRDLTVTADASYAHTLLPRTSDAYDVFSLTPLLYDVTLAKVGLVKEFNRVKITADGQFEQFNYEDGLGFSVVLNRHGANIFEAPIDEHFRDRDSFTGHVRGDYALSPEFAMFIDETVAHNSYNRTGFRNQDVTETLVGPNFEINHLVTAELGIGYLTSSFSDPLAKPVGAVHGRAKIIYFPTELITVTFTGDQGVHDSGVPTSPAYIATTTALQADYELLRNLIITGKVGDTWNAYRAIDRHDAIFDAKLSATYLANRWLGIVLAFSHTQRSSNGSTQAQLVNGFVALSPRFTDNAVSLALTLQR